MAKTAVPKANAPVNPGAPPFLPVVFVKPSSAGTSVPGTKPTPYVGTREDGCHNYLNYDAVTLVRYNGQNQTSTITQTGRP